MPQHVAPSNNRVDLLVFEDNEAVTKMIIKGRSPHLRHVSRAHRVKLVLFFFDRVNLDSIFKKIGLQRFNYHFPVERLHSTHQLYTNAIHSKFIRSKFKLLILLSASQECSRLENLLSHATVGTTDSPARRSKSWHGVPPHSTAESNPDARLPGSSTR